MDIEEIVRRLEAWKRRHGALTAAYEDMNKLTGATPDCELLRPVFDIWMAYTVAVSEIVGDREDWLQWYELECDMGINPKEARSDTGTVIKVRTLRQLARVIAW